MLYFEQDYIKKGLTLGLKENVEAIKKELSAEEQFLESVIKAEGFFKKYKKLLIALGVVVILAAAVYLISDFIKNRDLRISNEAFLVLQKDPSNKDALETLKSKNPKLFTLFSFSQAIKTDDPKKIEAIKDQITESLLKDLASYQSGALSEDLNSLKSYTQKQNALLKELAVLDEAFLLFEEGKGDDARAVLQKIPVTSSLYQLAQSFSHYQK